MIKPAILLAFADSRSDLPALQEERRALEDLLEKDFAVVSRDNATHARIDEIFRIHGQDLRVFHFAGHADGARLQLMATGGQDGAAYVQGLARLVGMQRGVELVFLNGCSTVQQVKYFLAEKLPAVIATTAPVSDQAARQFAESFYRNFLSGQGRCSLQEAFDQARAQLESRYPSYRDLYSRSLDFGESAFGSSFPYQLHLRTPAAAKLCYRDLLREAEGPEPEQIPPQAYLLLDRDDPNEAFEDWLRDCLRRPQRRPIACLVQGAEAELPLRFCERLHTFTLRETFKKLDKTLTESRFLKTGIEMPQRKHYATPHKALDVIKESLKEKLELEDIKYQQLRDLQGRELVEHLDPALEVVLLQHNFNPDDWDPAHSPAVLRQYLSAFWATDLPDGAPEVVLIFGLQYPPPRGLLARFQKPDSRISDCFTALAEVLGLLESVPRNDLRKWNDRYASADPALTDEIYGKASRLPMNKVLPKIEDHFKKYRQ